MGLGLTQVPATESILSVLPPAKAGVGSAVNDATRETGGTLGVAVVAVVDSIFASVFASGVGGSLAGLVPAPVQEQAKSSMGAAPSIAAQAGGDPAVATVQDAFKNAFHLGWFVAAGACWTGALLAVSLSNRVTAAAGSSHRPSRREGQGLMVAVRWRPRRCGGQEAGLSTR